MTLSPDLVVAKISWRAFADGRTFERDCVEIPLQDLLLVYVPAVATMTADQPYAKMAKMIAGRELSEDDTLIVRTLTMPHLSLTLMSLSSSIEKTIWRAKCTAPGFEGDGMFPGMGLSQVETEGEGAARDIRRITIVEDFRFVDKAGPYQFTIKEGSEIHWPTAAEMLEASKKD